MRRLENAVGAVSPYPPFAPAMSDDVFVGTADTAPITPGPVAAISFPRFEDQKLTIRLSRPYDRAGEIQTGRAAADDNIVHHRSLVHDGIKSLSGS